MSTLTKVTLKSLDGEIFELEVAAAMKSQIIKDMIEDGFANNVITLPIVGSIALAKITEYCKKQVQFEASPKKDPKVTEEAFKEWEAEFVKVDQDTLFEIILGANYMNIKGLLDLTCQTVADMIKGKTTEEIRSTFNISNDLSPEDEEEVRMENKWAFQ